MKKESVFKKLCVAILVIWIALPSWAQTFSTAVADDVALYNTGDYPTAETTKSENTLSYRIVEIDGQIWAKTITTKAVTGDNWAAQLRDWSATGNSKTELNLTARAGESLVTFNETGYAVVTSGTTKMQFFVNLADGGFHATDLFTFVQGETATVEGDNVAPVLGDVTCEIEDKNLTITLPECNEDCFYLLTDEATALTQVYMMPGTYTLGLSAGASYNIEVYAVDFSGNRSVAQTIKHTTAFDTSLNLALNRPVTASSGTPTSGNDGDEGTRWESASSDTEWWTVELANCYNLNYIEIKWEGAYSKHYTIDTSIDGEKWTSLDVTYDGGNNLLQTINMSGTPAKFVRFQGIERATGYGNSFWEFRVYGLSVYDASSVDELTVLQINPQQADIFVNESVVFSLAGLSGDGTQLDGVTYEVSAPENASVTDNGDGTYTFTSSVEGEYTVDITARKDDAVLEGEFKVSVKALPRLTTLTIAAPYTVTAAGTPIEITVTALDQYGATYPCTPEWVVTGDAAGEVLDNKYTASEMGTATLVAKDGDVSSNELVFNVVAVGENLALGKEVYGIDDAQNLNAAVDGDWWSQAILYPQDGELAASQTYDTHLVVDLEPQGNIIGYKIDLIELDWEGATAADYIVYVSADSIEWKTYGSLENGEGMTNRHDAFYLSAPGVNAEVAASYGHRYICLSVSKAATVYGVKLREIKVYGSPSYPSSVEASAASHTHVWRVGENIFATDDVCAVEIYNMSGMLVLSSDAHITDISALNAGAYIVRAVTLSGDVYATKVVK